MRITNNKPQGYVALITVAIVMSAVIIIGITITLLVTTGVLTTFTNDQGARAFYVADSCAYEALIRLKRDGLSYIGTHTLDVGDNECTIEVTAAAGDNVNVEVSGIYDDTTYRPIYLEVDTDPFTLDSWQETH